MSDAEDVPEATGSRVVPGLHTATRASAAETAADGAAARTDPAGAGEDGTPPARVRRLWASRRVPAGLVALVVLGAAGFLLTVVVMTRNGQHPFADAQFRLSRGLRERTWDDTWVRVASAIAAAVGLILLACGLLRGRRMLLPLRRRGALVGFIHRRALEAMVTDTAEHVRGVGAVNVNVHPRRHILVLASARYRDVDDVEHELEEELTTRLAAIGLDRPVPVRVRMDREKRRVR